jgi:predicted ATPase
MNFALAGRCSTGDAPEVTTMSMFGNRAARQPAERAIEISRAHDLAVYLSEGIGDLGWARARLGERETGIAQLKECIAVHAEQGNRLFIPFFQGLLSEIEAEGQGSETALTRIDEALALSTEMGAHWTDAFLHRLRGEILLKRDPTNTAPAEEAFFAAIAVAQQQKAKSFELQAALRLAKLYQLTGRPADAHVLLATAVEGFSPTPEFPEVAEAQALLVSMPQ